MTLPSAYGNMVYKMRNEREIEMTYEEVLKMATERWLPAGATPEEIEAAAKEMFEEEND